MKECRFRLLLHLKCRAGPVFITDNWTLEASQFVAILHAVLAVIGRHAAISSGHPYYLFLYRGSVRSEAHRLSLLQKTEPDRLGNGCVEQSYSDHGGRLDQVDSLTRS